MSLCCITQVWAGGTCYGYVCLELPSPTEVTSYNLIHFFSFVPNVSSTLTLNENLPTDKTYLLKCSRQLKKYRVKETLKLSETLNAH